MRFGGGSGRRDLYIEGSSLFLYFVGVLGGEWDYLERSIYIIFLGDHVDAMILG